MMRWAMTMDRGRWPETRTYHPDDPFSLWRDLDAHRSMLDRFFIKLLKLQEAMKTPSAELWLHTASLFCTSTCRNFSTN